ncbi:T9SS type A sorting domain-containing protein [Flavisolibacter sp. BT320]|nr:T9SS type A sorting domain-containing protein [Flavisolibacter longurius]
MLASSSNDCARTGVTLTATEGDSYRWSTGETTRSITVRQNGSYTVTVTKNGCSATSAPTVITCTYNSITQKGGGDTKTGVGQEVTASSSGLSVKALPNPSPSHFTLQVSGAKATERITLRILDGVGRLVETKTIAAGTQMQVGSTYRPGTYFAEVVQGAEKVTLKLVKTTGF